MAHGELLRAYNFEGRRPARVCSLPQGLSACGPRQSTASSQSVDGAYRRNRTVLVPRPTPARASRRATFHRRSERPLRAGKWSRSGGTAWAEHGESRQGREYTQRTGGRSRRANAVEGNQTGDLHEPDLQRTQRHTSPYTAPRSRSPLAWRRVEMPVSPRASSATRPFSYTFPHTAPRPRSPLAWGRASNPPVPLRGGG